jgi:hypothetical protein
MYFFELDRHISGAGEGLSGGIFFLWRYSPNRVYAASFLRLLDHTKLDSPERVISSL